MHFHRKPKHESGILCQTHKTYSLTCDDFEALWERSGGRCEACGFEPDRPERGLVIDHDHRYGNTAVRGLICRWCNAILGQLEAPDIHPPFQGGPGRWFYSYFERAWFVRNRRSAFTLEVPVDRKQLREEIRQWRKFNKALFSRDPKAALVPLDKPSVIAEILREEMSHQGFACLVRTLNEMRAPGKPTP